MIWIAVAITFAGFVGGLINRLAEVRDGVFSPDTNAVSRLDRFAVALLPYVLACASAWTVPLFLSLTKSTLVADATKNRGDLLVLFGLAIVAAIASRPFLDNLTSKVLSALAKADQASQQAATATTVANRAEDKAEVAEEAAEQAGALAASSTLHDTADQEHSVAHMMNQPELSPEQTRLLRLFHFNHPWAPSVKGVMREVDWNEDTTRATLASLVALQLLDELPTTPTRKWLRWTITRDGRRIARAL